MLPLRRRSFVFFAAVSLVLIFSCVYRHVDSLSASYKQQFNRIHPLQDENHVYMLPPPSVSLFFPPPSADREDYHEWNDRALRELHSCMALDNCGPNQRKVALLAVPDFGDRIVKGKGGGEGIWGQSIYNSLRALGYTALLANSFQEALYQYRMMPDLVKVVLRYWPADCQDHSWCVKNPKNPTGIPAWKIFDFWYWPSHGGHHPNNSRLGGKWILSSHPDDEYHGGESPIQYLGFSLEEECTKVPFIPLAERKNQIWLFMKLIRYVYDPWFSWKRDWFVKAAKELDIDIVGAWKVKQEESENLGYFDDIEDRSGRVINLGPNNLNHSEFIEEVRSSKVMLAVGNPSWSPSAWDALCLGVPFIQPVRNWDRNDPWNRLKWEVQHPSLKRFHPPYVYHVHRGNYTGFIEALKAATTTQISKFVPRFMTEAAMRERVTKLMETDWRALAAVVLEERLAANNGSYIFEL